MKEIKTYDAAKNNELTTTYLSFKTGGGTQREGLGKGIHWHIENDIEYIYTDTSQLQQEIPWVKVTDPEREVADIYRYRGQSAGRFCGKECRPHRTDGLHDVSQSQFARV